MTIEDRSHLRRCKYNAAPVLRDFKRRHGGLGKQNDTRAVDSRFLRAANTYRSRGDRAYGKNARGRAYFHA